jgi:hypothetical protein
MRQRRDGRQSEELIARPVYGVQTVLAAAIHGRPEWKEF